MSAPRSLSKPTGELVPYDLSKEKDARLVKAQDAYRGSAAEMRAFANGEWAANKIVIASALLSLSKNLSIKGHALHDAHQRVERFLRVRAIE